MRGGARIGAGRKAHLEDKTIETLLRLSASTVLKALRNNTLSEEFRAELASKIVVKAIHNPSENNNGTRSFVYIIAGTDKDIQKDILEVLPTQSTTDNSSLQS